MLMAWRHQDHELRRGSLPDQVQLPSFSTFISGLERSNGAPSRSNSSPTTQPTSLKGHEIRHAPPSAESFYRIPQFQQAPSSEINGESPQSTTGTELPSMPMSSEQNGRANSLGVPLAAAPTSHNRSQSMTNQLRPPFQPSTGSQGHAKSGIDEANIVGNGPCFVYDDGTVAQKLVNGDGINPKWGTTKAGKPRKRLGQACNTCREKKIRCDPQMPKCAQCQRFGRDCKFETRSSHKTNSSNSPRESLCSEPNGDTGDERHGSSASAETSTGRLTSREGSRSFMQVETLLSPSTIDRSSSDGRPPSKRQRFSTSPRDSINTTFLRCESPRPSSSHKPSASLSSTGFSLDRDPWTVDPVLAQEYLEHYFVHVNLHIFYLFPRRAFMEWATNSTTKSVDDLMVLYALLAFGSTFSAHADKDTHMRNFLSIAETRLDQCGQSLRLQNVHTYLILALLARSEANTERAGHRCDAALRTALSLNLHDGLKYSTGLDQKYYGLKYEQSVELKRRTFWTVYVNDLLNAYFIPGKQVEGYESCSLRLPCDNRLYEDGVACHTPFYRGHLTLDTGVIDGPELGHLAFLIDITTSINKIVTFSAETEAMHATQWEAAYESFYQLMTRRLHAWDIQVKSHFSTRNKAAKENGREQQANEDCLNIRSMFYHATMMLNRIARPEDMRQSRLERNCWEAHTSAIRLLEVTKTIADSAGEDVQQSSFARCNSLAGVAVFMAIDILTAAGTTSSVLEQERPEMELGSKLSFTDLISIGVGALETLSPYWRSAQHQLELVKRRFVTILNESRDSQKAGFYFSDSLGSMFGQQQDIVYYQTSRLVYLRARGLEAKVKSESDLFEMGGS